MAIPDPHALPSGPASDALAESGQFTLHEVLTLEHMFTPREARLVERLQGFCHGPQDPVRRDVRAALAQGFRGLGALAAALEAYPSVHGTGKIGAHERSRETLMAKLLEAGEHGLEWTLPTKGVLGRTFGIAKVNFWTSLQYALEARDRPEITSLFREVQEAIAEAVYTRLAEELYASYVTSPVTTQEVKRLAIDQLLELWDGRAGLATYRFCPVLRSAWVARCRAPRVFGTMMGTAEIASLLFQDCDARFVEWFIQEDDSEQVQAFEEFVFDLPFESLERVRTRMREEGRSVVGPEEVARYLGFAEGKLNPLIEEPKALYTSFRKRRVKAQYRTSMRIPGPKRTAESYVLEGLLIAARDEDAGEGDDTLDPAASPGRGPR